MNSMTIYLAGPIDGITKREAQRWREEVANEAPAGCLFFDPTMAWRNVSHAVAEGLDVGNRSAIMAADAVLANLSGPGLGFGTIREIEFAVRVGRPVAVAVGGMNRLAKTMMAYDIHTTETAVEALNFLIERVARERQMPRVQLVQLFGGNVHIDPDDDAES